MGTKNLVMLKTHINSINLFFANDFVYENVLWPLASLWVFFSNYVLSSMGMILTYIFRFQRKSENFALLSSAEQTKRNQFEDYEIDGFIEELANLLFPRFDEDFHITTSEEIEGETENSVPVEIDSDIQLQQDDEKREGEIECYVLKEENSDMYEEGKKTEGKSEVSVSMENFSDVKKIDENETECSVFMECDSSFQQDGRKRIQKIQEEQVEETKGYVVMDSGSALTTSKYQFVPQKEISGSVFDEEPMALSFSFSLRENFTSEENVSDSAFLGTGNVTKKELLEHNLEEYHVAKKEEEMGYNNSCEGFECESLKANEDVKETQFSIDIQVSHETHAGVDILKTECKNEKEGFLYHKEEECKDSLEDELDEMDYDEDNEEEHEWEHDELVEQLKLELRNARQGGLTTILEEEEEDEERETPKKVVGELKPLSIIEEKKMEYKDHIVEIQKVYRCYAEKIRKLDVLNCQAMHAIGLLQLKDPIKLKLMPKSTVQQVKPLVSQNLWPRKAPKKHTSDPMLKLVNELHRDLELVYVGQVCLSWEILCWQHRKIMELKKYDSQHRTYRYNLVAGEFQLFQVLIQRFIEDEPFQQGPRIQNYVKNRCVIRNLLQVPPIKDDITKDKKKVKWGEEDAITSERLAKIIEESMQGFWEFVRFDKDYENVFHKVSSHQNRKDVKDTEISYLLRDIQTQLQKKERKLKDKVRSRNCIIRKFQKHQEGQIQLDHDQFLAQVGLRLISRVINMKKMRKDQLIWCNEKLNGIKFIGRKIQVEPSFLLFPC